MHKLQTTLIGLLITLPSLLLSQDRRVESIMGAAIPISNFESNNDRKENAGYAELGINYSLSYEFRDENNFGIKALINSQVHKIDIDALLEQTPRSQSPNNKLSLKSNGYRIINVMGGVTKTFTFGESRASLTGQLLPGVAIVRSPENKLTQNNDISHFQEFQKSKTAVNFSLLLGARVNYDITDQFGVNLGLDGYITSIKFKDVGVTYKGSYQTTTDSINFERLITTLNSNLGFYFKF